MSDNSCKRVLSLSCGFNFPPMFFVFFRKTIVTYDYSSVVE